MNNFKSNKLVKVFALLLAIFMVSGDVAALAEAVVTEEVLEEVVEENVEEKEDLDSQDTIEEIEDEDNEDGKEDEVLIEDNVSEEIEETEPKEGEIEREEPENGEYMVRHEVIGTEEILYQESFPMEEGKIVKGEEREDHILTGETRVEVTAENNDITFYYYNRIPEGFGLKQVSMKYVTRDSEGNDIEIYPRKTVLTYPNEEYNFEGRELEGYELVTGPKAMISETAKDIVFEYRPRVSNFGAIEYAKSAEEELNGIAPAEDVYRDFIDVSSSEENNNIFKLYTDGDNEKTKIMDSLASIAAMKIVGDGKSKRYLTEDSIKEDGHTFHKIFDKRDHYSKHLGNIDGAFHLELTVAVAMAEETNDFGKATQEKARAIIEELSDYLFFDTDYASQKEYDEAEILNEGMDDELAIVPLKVYRASQLKKDNETIYRVSHIRNYKKEGSIKDGREDHIVEEMVFTDTVGAKIGLESFSEEELQDIYKNDDGKGVFLEEVTKTIGHMKDPEHKDEKIFKTKSITDFTERTDDNKSTYKHPVELELFETIEREYEETNSIAGTEIESDRYESLVNYVKFRYTDIDKDIEEKPNENFKGKYEIKFANKLGDKDNTEFTKAIGDAVKEYYKMSGEVPVGKYTRKAPANSKGGTPGENIIVKVKDEYVLVDAVEKTIDIEKKVDNTITFNYIKKDDLNKPDEDGNMHFIIEHYGVDEGYEGWKGLDKDNLRDKIAGLDEPIERTLGKDRIGNYVYGKDKQINYTLRQYVEELNRNYHNQPETPKKEGEDYIFASGFVIEEPAESEDSENLLKLYYLDIDKGEPEEGDKEDGETSKTEVEYTVKYKNVNLLNEGKTEVFDPLKDLNKDVTDVNLDRFKTFYEYKSKGVVGENVRVNGDREGTLVQSGGESVNIENYILLSKVPIIKKLEDGGEKLEIYVLYASNIEGEDPEIDEDLKEKGLARLSERHLLRNTEIVYDGSGNGTNHYVYEDIILPIVNKYSVPQKMKREHSDQLIEANYKPEPDDEWAKPEEFLARAGITYEVRLIYLDPTGKAKPPKHMYKAEVTIRHFDYDKLEDNSEGFKAYDYVVEVLPKIGETIKYSPNPISVIEIGGSPYNEQTLEGYTHNEVEIPSMEDFEKLAGDPNNLEDGEDFIISFDGEKGSGKYEAIRFYYRIMEGKIKIAVSYYAKDTDDGSGIDIEEDSDEGYDTRFKLITSLDQYVSVPSYTRYETYKKLFEERPILEDWQNFNWIEAKPKVLHVSEDDVKSNEIPSMNLYYWHDEQSIKPPTDPEPANLDVKYNIIQDVETNFENDTFPGSKGGKTIINSMYENKNENKTKNKKLREDINKYNANQANDTDKIEVPEHFQKSNNKYEVNDEAEFNLLSSNPQEGVYGGEIEFNYEFKSEGEMNGTDRRYYIRTVEQLIDDDDIKEDGFDKNQDLIDKAKDKEWELNRQKTNYTIKSDEELPKHYVEIFDPMTDLAEVGTEIDFEVKEEDKSIHPEEPEDSADIMYEILRHFKSNHRLLVTLNGSNEGFRIYGKGPDFKEDDKPTEPEDNKKIGYYRVNLKDRKDKKLLLSEESEGKDGEDSKGKLYSGKLALEYRVSAPQELNNDYQIKNGLVWVNGKGEAEMLPYTLVDKEANPRTIKLSDSHAEESGAKDVDFMYSPNSEDGNPDPDPEDPKDPNGEKVTYVVRHVTEMDIGDGIDKFRDIVNPTEHDGVVDSKVTLRKLDDEHLIANEIELKKNYTFAKKIRVNGKTHTDSNDDDKGNSVNVQDGEAVITLLRDNVYEVLFIYKKNDGVETEVDPDPEYKPEEAKYTVLDRDTKKVEIRKFENLTIPVKAEVIVLRENNYTKEGTDFAGSFPMDLEGEKGKIDENGIPSKYTLYSKSRNEYKPENETSDKTLEFVYQNNNLLPTLGRYSVRYVENDVNFEKIKESKTEEEYERLYKELVDIRKRSVAEGGKQDVEVRLINGEIKTADDINYEYSGIANSTPISTIGDGDLKTEFILETDPANGRVDIILAFDKIDQGSGAAASASVDSNSLYSGEIYAEGPGISVSKRIYSDTPEVEVDSIDIPGYEAKDMSSKKVTLSASSSTMPVGYMSYDKVAMGEIEEEDEDIEVELPEIEDEDKDKELPEEPIEKPEVEEPKKEEPKEETKPESSGGGGGGGGGSAEEPEKSVVEKDKDEEILPEVDKEIEKLDIPKVDSDTGSKDYSTKGAKVNTDPEVTYITGYADNTIRPNENITRQEVAAIIYRVMDEDFRADVKTNDHGFIDIAEETWSREFIATLSNAELITGFKDGTFKPQDSMTRAELATIIARLNGLDETEDTKFNDLSDHWAAGNINAVAKEGWIKGYDDGTFRPTEKVTRAELITMINNMLGRDVENADDNKEFDDLEDHRWYYNQIQVAVSNYRL